MTTYDFDALTKAQDRVLGLIAIGRDEGHNERTLLALAKKDLIVGHRVNMGGHPPMTVVRWEMPIPVHMAWCAWCAEKYGDEDAT